MRSKDAIIGFLAGAATWVVVVVAVLPLLEALAASNIWHLDVATFGQDVLAPFVVGFVTVYASRGCLKWYHGGLMGCQLGLWVLLIWLCWPSLTAPTRTAHHHAVPGMGLHLIVGIGVTFAVGALGGALTRATRWRRPLGLWRDDLARRVYRGLRFAAATITWPVIWLLVAATVGHALGQTRALHIPLLIYAMAWLAMWFTLGWSWARLVCRAPADCWRVAFGGIAAVVTIGVAAIGFASWDKVRLPGPVSSAVLAAVVVSLLAFVAASALAANYGALLSRKRGEFRGHTT